MGFGEGGPALDASEMMEISVEKSKKTMTFLKKLHKF